MVRPDSEADPDTTTLVDVQEMVDRAVKQVVATMHGITSSPTPNLGPVPKSIVELDLTPVEVLYP